MFRIESQLLVVSYKWDV